jgi:hypothetical protein
MRVSKLTEGLRLIEFGVKVFENINSKGQQAATRQGLWRCLLVMRRL